MCMVLSMREGFAKVSQRTVAQLSTFRGLGSGIKHVIKFLHKRPHRQQPPNSMLLLLRVSVPDIAIST